MKSDLFELGLKIELLFGPLYALPQVLEPRSSRHWLPAQVNHVVCVAVTIGTTVISVLCSLEILRQMALYMDESITYLDAPWQLWPREGTGTVSPAPGSYPACTQS